MAVPALEEYAPEVQARAADELDTLSPNACPRDAAFGGCSAVRRLLADYVTLRDRIRAANAE